MAEHQRMAAELLDEAWHLERDLASLRKDLHQLAGLYRVLTAGA